MLRKKVNLFFLLISLIFAFNMVIFSDSIIFGFNERNLYDTNNDSYALKISGPEINITTPENITYTEPMSGYYPGTYSFDDAIIGQTAPGWTDSDNDGAVIAEMDGHKKVYAINDSSSSNAGDVTQTWNSTQTYGTVEGWLRVTNTFESSYFYLREGGQNLCKLHINENSFKYKDDTGTYIIAGAPTPQNNTWYHIRFDFRGSYGSTYQGLTSQYTYMIFIDGVSYGPYKYALNNDLTEFHVHTGFVDDSVTIFWDAIGYSWDPNYNIGDNMNEGLLLSFDTSFTPDWLGYSLDSQFNKTILGNTTIPFPTNDGLHSLQIFGNNSIGTIFESDIRYFTTQLFDIVTPENKTYTEPMSGYYPATYGFENDKIGEDPEEWYMTMEDGDAKVSDEVDGHKNVLELVSTTGKVRAGQNFTAPHTTGTIEAYIRINDTSKVLYFLIQEDWYNSIHFAMSSDGNFYYYDGSWHSLIPYNANQWYHVRFEFDVATDWHLWIDGISIDGGSGYNFRGVPSSLNLLLVAAENPNSICYTDAIGYSWDPNYNIGNNLNEGLLLSFENNLNFDWIGYSLDHQSTRQILGNSTILLPNEGHHTIQVFGTYLMGPLHQSYIRYFSTDFTAPTSMISFTPYKDPDIVIKSTFFTITADDGLGSGVSLKRYKINNSIWFDYLGPFNLSDYDYGEYLITYQAIDVVGHIESEKSISVLLIPEPSEPGIPGYHLFAIIGIIGIVSAIIIKKRFKLKF